MASQGNKVLLYDADGSLTSALVGNNCKWDINNSRMTKESLRGSHISP